MSESLKVRAIILKRWDYGEKDQIISFLGEGVGRLQGIAKASKASRRRFGGALDLFCFSELHFKERRATSLVFLEQARLISPFPRIRENYNSILLASGLIETVYQLYREGSGAEGSSFDILLGSLRALEEGHGKSGVFFSALLQHLRVGGMAPEFSACVRCHSASGPFAGFEPPAGGLICLNCAGSSVFRLPAPDSLRRSLLQWQSSQGLLKLSEDEETALRRILKEHLQFQMNLDLDWDRFLEFVE